jgi:hypothetical protein
MHCKHWLALLVLAAAPALASGNGCKFRAERSGNIDAAGAEKAVIRAGAGDLKVTGRTGAARAEAHGVACASTQALLDATQISVRREGAVLYVETTLPQENGKWSWTGNSSASLDISIDLPANLAVDAVDSSGDAELSGLKSLQMQDSSGDLKISNIDGAVDLGDSSGDLSISGAGSARVSDSSGDMSISNVRGDVEVVVDSSGDIRIVGVGGNVKIQQDTSGNIHVEDVKGNFDVNSDSSGDIYAGHVRGDFTVGQDSSGDIQHEDIGGKISVPKRAGDGT